MFDWSNFKQELVSALGAVLPDIPLKDMILQHAVLIVTVITILVVLGILIINFAFDVITDIWKIPLAVIVDVLFYLGLTNAIYGLIATILGVLLFLFIGDSVFWKFVFAIIIAVTGLGAYFIGAPIFILFVVFPLTTVLMLIDVIVD